MTPQPARISPDLCELGVIADAPAIGASPFAAMP
jgi:hypothetical protein